MKRYIQERPIVMTVDAYRDLYREHTPVLREKLALFHESLDEASKRLYLNSVWIPVYDWPETGHVLFSPVEHSRLVAASDWTFFHTLAEECGLFSWKSHPGRVSDRSSNLDRIGNPEFEYNWIC